MHLLKVPVQEVSAERSGEFFRQIHGAVLATGATQRNGQVVLSFAAVVRQHGGEQIGQFVEERPQAGIRRDEAVNGFIAAGERAQFRFIMWVPQETDIEYQIGLARQSVAIRKGGHADGQSVGAPPFEVPRQYVTQLGRRQGRGVDDQVGPGTQRRQQVAFRRDPVGDRAAAGQRMAAAGFRKAPPQ